MAFRNTKEAKKPKAATTKKTKKGGRIEEKIAISKVSEIYDYREKLLKTVEAYLNGKK